MDVSLEFGPSFTMATAHLKPGDSIKVEPGAMVSQSMGLEMKTGMSGKGGGLGAVSYTHLTLPTRRGV